MQKSHRRGKPSFKVPNRLIVDGALSYSARRMGAVLYGHHNPLGACRKSLAHLAALASCSVATARTALEELIAGGYITRVRNYRYHELLKRPVYDRYTYQCDLKFDGGYTLVPRSLFERTLKSSTFVCCLYLYLRAGNGTRAFPSLKRTSRDVCMALSTVCRALKALVTDGVILAQVCIKANQSHSNNSYFFLCSCAVTVSAVTDAPAAAGRVSVLSFLSRAVMRPHKRLHRGAAPLPCHHHYIAIGKRFQVISMVRGTFKISKQSKDLDNVRLYYTDKTNNKLPIFK